jgi:hypothetical protein
MRDGGVVGDFLAAIEATAVEAAGAGEGLAPIGERLGEAHRVLGEATRWLLERGAADPADALAGATPYLRMAGIVTGGWLLARSAISARQLLDAGATGATSARLEQKLVTARFFCDQLLPQAEGLLPAVTAGSGVLAAAVL